MVDQPREVLPAQQGAVEGVGGDLDEHGRLRAQCIGTEQADADEDAGVQNEVLHRYESRIGFLGFLGCKRVPGLRARMLAAVCEPQTKSDASVREDQASFARPRIASTAAHVKSP